MIETLGAADDSSIIQPKLIDPKKFVLEILNREIIDKIGDTQHEESKTKDSRFPAYGEASQTKRRSRNNCRPQDTISEDLNSKKDVLNLIEQKERSSSSQT